MSGRLDHCKATILAVDGFDEAERVAPRRVLAADGARADRVAARGA
ncbi:hypothetical protein [Burkholderia sp. LMG 21824]